MQQEQQGEKLKAFFPVTVFIATTFFLAAVSVEDSINLIIAVLLSLFSYGVMSAQLKEKVGDRPELKPLNRYLFYLTVLLVLIIVTAIVHNKKLISIDYRFALILSLMLIYFIVLFRAVSQLNRFRQMLQPNKTGK